MRKDRKNNSRITIDNENILLQELINDYSRTKQLVLAKAKDGIITKEEFLEDVNDNIDFMYEVDEDIRQAGITLFMDFVFGYSRLSPLINDPDISDIHCNSYNNIRIKKKGVRMASNVAFQSEQEFTNFVNFVATRNQVNISNLNAIQRFTDYDSNPNFILRFTLTMPLVNTYDSPYLVIRKVPKNFPLLNDLVEAEMLNEEVADLLKHRFSKGSTLICGGNSSGKTTILNALKEDLPEDYAILIAQQADELTRKHHPDIKFLHSLPGSSESQAKYDLQHISITGLTMDIDFFIIGEVKGDEAAYLLNAAYTGQLCAATIHAPSADKAINKLVDYAMANSRYKRNELMKMMDCFDTVVFMKKYKVSQIYAVKDYNYKTDDLQYEAIWENGGFVNGYNADNAKN